MNLVNQRRRDPHANLETLLAIDAVLVGHIDLAHLLRQPEQLLSRMALAKLRIVQHVVLDVVIDLRQLRDVESFELVATFFLIYAAVTLLIFTLFLLLFDAEVFLDLLPAFEHGDR